MKLTLVWADDWEALYVDGVLKTQGHSLSPSHIFEATGLDCEELEAERNEFGDYDFTNNLSDMKVVG